jgi:HlyD family secretion protein
MNALLSHRSPSSLRPGVAAVLAALAFGLGGWSSAHAAGDDKAAKPAAAASAVSRPALTVTTTTGTSADWPIRLSANGNVAAWQEASIGAEVSGLRLTDVKVNVGDVVRRGQLLATFSDVTVQADVTQSRAALAEAEAALAEATANADRARQLQESGAMSAQQINQMITAERTAQARLQSARAALANQQTRLKQTQLVAPDAGVISARSATVGAVVNGGQELFRLIRNNRLEWRAEVPAADLARIKPGMAAQVTPAGGATVQGKVRMLAPTVDPQTRNGLVYVDLTQPGDARAGMFARGEFNLGATRAVTLPQSAVLLRDGFAFVFRVGEGSRVAMTKVSTGRRVGDRVEIIAGLEAGTRVVASGGGFLSDGDTVTVVETPTKSAAK